MADGAAGLGLAPLPASLRAPHILGLRPPAGLPTGLVDRLQRDRVYVSERSGALRISPHVWADEDDLARCLAALSGAFRGIT
ncbi:hypothetical protein [Methylobacterium oryzae]|uniref:hypothetical protein n=1 Tax=Methylobacterium oryzae TaxID=334852 RepID=UPI002F355A1D